MISETAISGEQGCTAALAQARVQTGSAPTWSRQHNDHAMVSALAIVAHDLRGPLANLSILAELIEINSQKQAYERVPAHAQRARTIIQALDGMLSSILERVKTSGDPLGFTPSLVDLNDVVESAMVLNQPVAESRSVRLHCSTDETLTIRGDKRLLLQAIENLVNNAVKHTPSGTTVLCETERVEDHAVIRISDQGGGFNPCDLKQAFRPFSSLSSKPEQDVRSWGLGLWICRLIVERHGGHIDANTVKKDGGAVFTLRLPMIIG